MMDGRVEPGNDSVAGDASTSRPYSAPGLIRRAHPTTSVITGLDPVIHLSEE
jgi:hypothetical protein